MSLRLTLISEATTRVARSAQFPSDEPLDREGEEQAKAATNHFQVPRIAYTSPALRARQTACALGFTATVDIALSDCDYGCWANRSLEDVEAHDPAAFAAWVNDPYSAPHGGESIVAVLQRVAGWFNARFERGRVTAVTHPAIVRAAVVHVLGASVEAFWRIDVNPLRGTEFSYDGRRWMLRSMNRVL
jgi:broad specificity phosphatase PhoE